MRKLAENRLALKLDTNAIGWCFTKHPVKILPHQYSGEPSQRALELVAPDQHVDIIVYSDDVAYQQSQAFRDGLTRTEHIKKCQGLVLYLKMHHRHADLKWVSIDDKN